MEPCAGGMRVGMSRDELRHLVRRTLTALSQTGALPSLPATGRAVLALAREPMVDADRVAGLVGTDVGLAARVLRLANPGRVTSVHALPEAIAVAGVRRTCEVVAAAAARELYAPADAQVQALWKHALATAIAAEELARVTGRVPQGHGFLPGLFHDVGRIAFLLTDGMSFDVISHLVATGQGDALDLEREWYGFTHAEAGAVLAEDWGLAPAQCDAIRWHHAPTDATQGRELAAVLEVADRVAHQAGLGAGPGRPPAASLGSIGLSAADAAACTAHVQRALVEQRAFLE